MTVTVATPGGVQPAQTNDYYLRVGRRTAYQRVDRPRRAEIFEQ